MMHPQPNENYLAVAGPKLQVKVGVSVAGEGELQQRGRPIPKPLLLRAIIDKSIKMTCISQAVVNALDLKECENETVTDNGNQVDYPTYTVSINVLLADEFLGNWEVTSRPDQENDLCLIGWDILQFTHLTYSGCDDSFSLTIKWA